MKNLPFAYILAFCMGLTGCTISHTKKYGDARITYSMGQYYLESIWFEEIPIDSSRTFKLSAPNLPFAVYPESIVFSFPLVELEAERSELPWIETRILIEMRDRESQALFHSAEIRFADWNGGGTYGDPYVISFDFCEECNRALQKQSDPLFDYTDYEIELTVVKPSQRDGDTVRLLGYFRQEYYKANK